MFETQCVEREQTIEKTESCFVFRPIRCKKYNRAVYKTLGVGMLRSFLCKPLYLGCRWENGICGEKPFALH